MVMVIDRKKLVCFVVATRNASGAQRWCALNEDREWLANLAAGPAAAAEKAGVYCCNPSQELRRAAAQALGVEEGSEFVVHKLFQSSDSDECAEVISRKVALVD
ncbi:hypothetical protein PIGHUM_03430 [Pigmentiphaga humi]|uniref:Uncharacterized protein n=1 Tax=Pigmentiphaga humi TaxID=2478468 RepID=A0A3P4B4X5_9BURK|nr:hypothetical protein [Pigmentiphaga humi]VCU71349.1 hypothetical protein PIGHUM_03430 [Pigmentiphaga humi]